MVDFEVTVDPLEEASAIGLLLDPERHKLEPEGHWLRWAKRFTGRDDLVVYRHLEQGTWVLGVWVIPGKVITELVAMSGPPDHWPWDLPDREYLKSVVRPAEEQVRQMKRDMKALGEGRKQARLEAAEARKEAAKHLRRKGLGEGAAGMDAWRPWTSDDASGEAGVFEGMGRVMG